MNTQDRVVNRRNNTGIAVFHVPEPEYRDGMTFEEHARQRKLYDNCLSMIAKVKDLYREAMWHEFDIMLPELQENSRMHDIPTLTHPSIEVRYKDGSVKKSHLHNLLSK